MRFQAGLLALLVLTACETFDSRKVEQTSPAQDGPVSRLWFDDAGTRLFSQSAGTVRVWDVATGTLEKRAGPGLSGPGAPAGIVLIADDLSKSAVYTGTVSRGTLAVQDGTDSWQVRLDRTASPIGFAAGGVLIVYEPPHATGVGIQQEPGRVATFAHGAPVPELDRLFGTAASATVSPDGKRLALVRDGKEIAFVDVERRIEEHTVSTLEPMGLLFSQDSSRLALFQLNRLRFLDVATGAETGGADLGITQLTLTAFPGDLFASTFLGDELFRFGPDGTKKWDWAIRDAQNRNVRLWRWAAALDTDRLVVSLDNDLQVFDPASRRSRTLCKKPCYGPQSNLIEAIAVTRKGDLAAVAAGRSLVLWTTDRSKPPRPLTDPDLK